MDNLVFVLVFLFDPNGDVLLRLKLKDWQRGKWNGLGGRMDPAVDKEGEYFCAEPYHTAIRTTKEESGLEIEDYRFKHVLSAHYPTCELEVYYVNLTGEEASKARLDLEQHTDAPQRWFTMGDLNSVYNHDTVALQREGIALDDKTGVEFVKSTYEYIELIKSFWAWEGVSP